MSLPPAERRDERRTTAVGPTAPALAGGMLEFAVGLSLPRLATIGGGAAEAPRPGTEEAVCGSSVCIGVAVGVDMSALDHPPLAGTPLADAAGVARGGARRR